MQHRETPVSSRRAAREAQARYRVLHDCACVHGPSLAHRHVRFQGTVAHLEAEADLHRHLEVIDFAVAQDFVQGLAVPARLDEAHQQRLDAGDRVDPVVGGGAVLLGADVEEGVLAIDRHHLISVTLGSRGVLHFEVEDSGPAMPVQPAGPTFDEDSWGEYDEDVVVGIGDDCAVLRRGNILEVITTDCLGEGTHFQPGWLSMGDIGFKAMAVNISDVAAMGAGDVAHDGEPEPAARGLRLAVGSRLVEAVEDLLEILVGNAAPGVGDPDRHPIASRLDDDHDPTSGLGVGQGVADQIEQDLPYLPGIAYQAEVG